jgi:hypothetical protein
MTLQKIPQLWCRFFCFLKRKKNRDCLKSLDVDSSGETQSAAAKGSRAKTTVQCRKEAEERRAPQAMACISSNAQRRGNYQACVELLICQSRSLPLFWASDFQDLLFLPSHLGHLLDTWIWGRGLVGGSGRGWRLRHKIALLVCQSRSLPLFWAPGFLGPTFAFTAWPPCWHLDLKTWVGPEAYDTSFIHLHPHHR